MLIFNKIIFFIILYSLNEKYLIDSELVSKYCKFTDGYYIILYIGTPPQRIPVKLDLNGQYPLVSSNDYRPTKSSSSCELSYMHFTRKKRGFLVQGYQDVWKLTNDSQYDPQNMFFYTLGTYHESSLTSFPLFYQITLEKYSFIHMYIHSSNIHPFEYYL